ncbi:hypothetical protein M2128_001539 [Polynucleobacter sphagniphilus]|nr:hypothetical protein [Polynucleobacter sphagniphilus]MDH6302605.1 hypothetical protein [Polynucleobacter sphagniphilus]
MIKNTLWCWIALAGMASNIAIAQSTDLAIGIWKTIDDKTNQPASLIKIEEVNGALEGTIIKTFPSPGVIFKRMATLRTIELMIASHINNCLLRKRFPSPSYTFCAKADITRQNNNICRI